MKVLFVANKDSANMGFLLAQALRSVYIEARSLAYRPAPRPPGIHSLKAIRSQMIEQVKHYDVIQFMHTEYIDLGNLKGKLISVFHGGYVYRNNPKEATDFWNKKAHCQLVQTGDLLGLGAKNEEWLLPPVDTDLLKPNFKLNKKPYILHCPSVPKKKGTEPFKRLMTRIQNGWKLKDMFRWKVGEKTAWAKNIERIRNCDIYFDACQPKLRGKPYGFWGMSALEAAALGKVVVTHFAHKEKEYVERYGTHPLQVANNMKAVREQLMHLLTHQEEIPSLQKKTREWAVRNHSMKVVGERLKEIYRRYI